MYGNGRGSGGSTRAARITCCSCQATASCAERSRPCSIRLARRSRSHLLRRLYRTQQLCALVSLSACLVLLVSIRLLKFTLPRSKRNYIRSSDDYRTSIAGNSLTRFHALDRIDFRTRQPTHPNETSDKQTTVVFLRYSTVPITMCHHLASHRSPHTHHPIHTHHTPAVLTVQAA